MSKNPQFYEGVKDHCVEQIADINAHAAEAARVWKETTESLANQKQTLLQMHSSACGMLGVEDDIIEVESQEWNFFE